MNKILKEYVDKYYQNENTFEVIRNMKNYYDNEDEYWYIIEELLDENNQLKEKIKELEDFKWKYEELCK